MGDIGMRVDNNTGEEAYYDNLVLTEYDGDGTPHIRLSEDFEDLSSDYFFDAAIEEFQDSRMCHVKSASGEKKVMQTTTAGMPMFRKTFDVSKCYCFDDNDAQEYYICYDGQALVYNYAANAWSYYTQFPVSCMGFVQKELFIGSPDGKLKRVSYEYLNDDGEAVDAYWESGSLGFGADYLRKYAAMLWIGIKPETSSEVWVTVQTDRNSQLQEKVVATYMATFTKANFARWSFRTNRKPHMTRLKIKAKKFVFYKLIFESSSADTRATILAADIRVRMTGYAK
jgi:hypothetical protein